MEYQNNQKSNNKDIKDAKEYRSNANASKNASNKNTSNKANNKSNNK